MLQKSIDRIADAMENIEELIRASNEIAQETLVQRDTNVDFNELDPNK